jgi:hypothetical protein
MQFEGNMQSWKTHEELVSLLRDIPFDKALYAMNSSQLLKALTCERFLTGFRSVVVRDIYSLPGFCHTLPKSLPKGTKAIATVLAGEKMECDVRTYNKKVGTTFTLTIFFVTHFCVAGRGNHTKDAGQ